MLKQLITELNKAGDAKRAKASTWFFKSEKGSYGYGDVFIGVRVPTQRLIAKNYRNLSLSDIQKLLNSKIHEHRLTALIILVEQFSKADETLRKKIYNLYLKNTNRINNWDLVDSSAGYIVGGYLLNKPKNILEKLAKSDWLWDRRIAIIATFGFIYQNKLEHTFKIAKMLLNDKHDLIHKAVGWMLREAGKRDRRALENFLAKYASQMPRTALRYAIEHFPKQKRLHYMQKR